MAILDNDLFRDFFLGFVRLHILFHAGHEPVCGVDLMAEMDRHGYRIGAGTLYPLLHRLERAGLLRCEVRVVAGRQRKYYRSTPAGAAVLAEARIRLRELVGEVVEDQGPPIGGMAAQKEDGR
jgi:DNA-binding PadR family transcriptional regulator